MRVAIAGKGGTGKTTIAGTLARVMARRRPVLAIDADTNPNLANMLGISAEAANELVGLPSDLLQRETAEDGTTRTVFRGEPDELIEQYGAVGPDGVRLLVMGRVGHSGKG